ncbi:hypothetical protein TNCV_2243311 [Trichonephila clavipes]|nr:hypothetical protein TNCV_2243311 [Trichonephila clavipes]
MMKKKKSLALRTLYSLLSFPIANHKKLNSDVDAPAHNVIAEARPHWPVTGTPQTHSVDSPLLTVKENGRVSKFSLSPVLFSFVLAAEKLDFIYARNKLDKVQCFQTMIARNTVYS